MSAAILGYTVLALLITLVWLRRHVDLSRAKRTAAVLIPESDDRLPDPAPPVSVIVAARDEQVCIEACVTSLVKQDYPNLEVIVVNDRSRDKTGEILDRLQQEHPERLRVLTVTEPRPGWLGKPNAVQNGVNVAKGDYLVFTDADCVQVSDRTIAVAMRYALERRIDFLSIIPMVEPNCPTEALVQPVCVAVLMLWHPPEKVNDPNKPHAYANGAFMMFERQAYDRIGGHEPVRHAFCEDMLLARRAKNAGLNLHVIQNRGLYRSHMYHSFRETWRGWSRIFQGAMFRPAKVLIAAVVLFLFSLLPWLSVATALVGFTLDAGAWRWPLAAWTLAVVAQLSIMLRFYPLARAPAWRALTYFPAAILCFAYLLTAAVKMCGVGTTSWAGTTYNSVPRSNG